MPTQPPPLPLQPYDADGPVFRAPWEAQVFALAVSLLEAGLFTWDEWAVTLGAEIAAAQASGDPDLGDTYYEHWYRALERLMTEMGLVDQTSIGERSETWRRAHLNTPHGRPVELSAGE